MDDEDMKLRDKFAIEILQAHISSATSKISIEFVKYFDDTGMVQEEAINRMERLIRASYKIADMMRKVRLSVFE